MKDKPDENGIWPLYFNEDDGYAVPCIGCGFCCKEVRCEIGMRVHGPGRNCPSLVAKDGRHWCGEVEKAPPSEAAKLRASLYVGAGCCSSMNSDRRSLLRSSSPSPADSSGTSAPATRSGSR